MGLDRRVSCTRHARERQRLGRPGLHAAKGALSPATPCNVRSAQGEQGTAYACLRQKFGLFPHESFWERISYSSAVILRTQRSHIDKNLGRSHGVMEGNELGRHICEARPRVRHLTGVTQFDKNLGMQGNAM